MLGGQTADVTLAGKPLSDEQLEYIYANKTAALLECAMQIGAVLGGASEEEAEVVRRAAYDAGIAFQVQDDILDMTGTAEELGKEVGQDERNEKTTYVTLRGMDAAKAYVQEKTDPGPRSAFLREWGRGRRRGDFGCTGGYGRGECTGEGTDPAPAEPGGETCVELLSCHSKRSEESNKMREYNEITGSDQ